MRPIPLSKLFDLCSDLSLVQCSKCKEPISEEDFADHNGNPHHVRCA